MNSQKVKICRSDLDNVLKLVILITKEIIIFQFRLSVRLVAGLKIKPRYKNEKPAFAKALAGVVGTTRFELFSLNCQQINSLDS